MDPEKATIGRSSQAARRRPEFLAESDPHPTNVAFRMPLKMMRSGKRCEPYAVISRDSRYSARDIRCLDNKSICRFRPSKAPSNPTAGEECAAD